MKPPPYVHFEKDLRLVVWRPRGILDETAVNQVITFLGEMEARSGEPFNRFSDSLEVDAVELNFRYIFHVSLFRRLSYAGRSPVKSAILVTDVTLAQYSRLHAILTQGSPLQVQIFEEREAAARWLGVAIDVLEAK